MKMDTVLDKIAEYRLKAFTRLMGITSKLDHANPKNPPLIFGWTSVAVGNYGFTLDLGYRLKSFGKVDFDQCYERALAVTFDGVTLKSFS